MIAENPMAEFGVEYVVHTQEPRFIAKKVYNNPTSDFEIVMEIDNLSIFFAGRPERMAALMRRLGDWWKAYITWEENNIDREIDEED